MRIGSPQEKRGIPQKGNMRCSIHQIFALTLVAGTLSAQSADRVRADIPFDFQVGSKTLPAGVYDVTQLRDSSPNVLRFSNVHYTKVNMMTMAGSRDSSKLSPRLTFSRQGDEYVLNGITNGSLTWKIPEGAAQPKLAKTNSSEITVMASLR
jgi:hypothetical protein